MLSYMLNYQKQILCFDGTNENKKNEKTNVPSKKIKKIILY